MSVLRNKTASQSGTQAVEKTVTISVPRGLPRRQTLKERALGGLAATLNDCFGPRERRAFGILMYHRVTNPVPGEPTPT